MRAMMLPALTRFCPLLLSLGLSACASQPPAPLPAPTVAKALPPAPLALTVPVEAQVSVIKVSDFSVSAPQHPLSDRVLIRQVLDFVSAHNKGLTKLPGTFPNPQASAALCDADNDMRLVIWFGDGWVGATDFHNKGSNSLMWDLDTPQQRQLRLMLGLPDLKKPARRGY